MVPKISNPNAEVMIMSEPEFEADDTMVVGESVVNELDADVGTEMLVVKLDVKVTVVLVPVVAVGIVEVPLLTSLSLNLTTYASYVPPA